MPNRHIFFYTQGLCFNYQEKTDKAVESFEMVLKIDPEHDRAKEKSKQAENSKKLKDNGNEAFKSGNYESALDNYSKALTVDPMNKSLKSKLYFNRATVHSKLGDLQKCLEDCTKALDNDPNYLKPLLRRAKSYMELKDFENAVKDFEKAHEMGLYDIDTKQLLKDAKMELRKSVRKDYHGVLEIDTQATDEDIKKVMVNLVCHLKNDINLFHLEKIKFSRILKCMDLTLMQRILEFSYIQ